MANKNNTERVVNTASETPRIVVELMNDSGDSWITLIESFAPMVTIFVTLFIALVSYKTSKKALEHAEKLEKNRMKSRHMEYVISLMSDLSGLDIDSDSFSENMKGIKKISKNIFYSLQVDWLESDELEEHLENMDSLNPGNIKQWFKKYDVLSRDLLKKITL